jgi:hypothetical protein
MDWQWKSKIEVNKMKTESKVKKVKLMVKWWNVKMDEANKLKLIMGVFGTTWRCYGENMRTQSSVMLMLEIKLQVKVKGFKLKVKMNDWTV